MKTREKQFGRVVCLILISVISSAAVVGCQSITPAKGKASIHDASARAVWLWNTDEIIGEHKSGEFASFCSKNSVGLALVNSQGNKRSIKPLISACSRKGIEVHALAGSPEMALPMNHSKVLRFVDDIIHHNATCRPEERIDGIHLDIEPYLLKEYESDRKKQVLSEYVNLICKTKSHIDGKGAGLLFGADLPFWLDRGKAPVAEQVIDSTDYVCIMAYRNFLKGKDGVINIAADEARYASSRGKKLFVGLETGSGKGIPEKTTFAGKGKNALNKAAAAVEKAFAGEESFAGVAIHHYKSWSIME